MTPESWALAIADHTGALVATYRHATGRAAGPGTWQDTRAALAALDSTARAAAGDLGIDLTIDLPPDLRAPITGMVHGVLEIAALTGWVADICLNLENDALLDTALPALARAISVTTTVAGQRGNPEVAL